MNAEANGVTRVPRESKVLWQVQARHFCAGLVMYEDRVVEAAPIIRYMVGWNLSRVREACAWKGWKLWQVEATGEP